MRKHSSSTSSKAPLAISLIVMLTLCLLLVLSQSTLFSEKSDASFLPPAESDNYVYFQQWGNGGPGNGQFSSPRDVAFDAVNHWLYVADEVNGRIQKFDANGNYLAQWTGLKKPYGVAVAPDSTVYVTNAKKNNVRHYDSNGTLLKQWGSKGSGNGQFQNPHGIAVDQSGNVYVADTDNSRIQKFNSTGKFLKAWSATKSGLTPLANPYGVAVDSSSNVFVADTAYHRIVKYNSNGKFIKTWGKQGTGNGKFKFPRSVEVDSAGNVYVTEDENYRVQKFTNSGAFLSKFGQAGSGDGQFNHPHGIAVEPSGDYIYVGDTNNNRIQKFQREGIVTNTPTATATATSTATPTNTPTPTSVTWAKAYGGSNQEGTNKILQVSDGYLVVAESRSFDPNGGVNAWLLKLDTSGNVQWQKSYGSTGEEQFYSAARTNDNGYVLAGYTTSSGAGGKDIWVIKINDTGSVSWQKTFGGGGDDIAHSIVATSDGGYIIAGSTSSFGAGANDGWILKLDDTGNIVWQKTYGGGADDILWSIAQTSDHGYIVGGFNSSAGAGSSDSWALKLDASGGITWQKTYGGTLGDGTTSIVPVTDGYLDFGSADSFGAGHSDAWAMKLNTSGDIVWQKTYGGSNTDVIQAGIATADGGGVMAGLIYSADDQAHFWIVKLDSTGAVSWQKVYGGNQGEEADSVATTNDGGYIVAGGTNTYGTGSDSWVLKLNANGNFGGGCSIGVSFSPTIGSTSVNGANTSATPSTTSVTAGTTSATVTDTSASVSEQCSVTTGSANNPNGIPEQNVH